jgi:RNA polymerase sigma-70 factor (ECF subfamily)
VHELAAAGENQAGVSVGVDDATGQGGGEVTENAFDKAEAGQLEQQFQRALDELPRQCKAIFQLSRFSELKYREIADQLGISIKTVEAQMSKALKLLRSKLADYLQ